MNVPQPVDVPAVGPGRFDSPLPLNTQWGDGIVNFVPDEARVRFRLEVGTGHETPEYLFEKAGPRARLRFQPSHTRAAIVTCGGLCPGLNNIIRSAFFELHHNYGVREVLGLRYGFLGLTPQSPLEPLTLSRDLVDHIHEDGGTMLGTSRGPQDAAVMVDWLVSRDVHVLLCVGGDGTQRGARKIADEARRRGLNLAVVGIPKTIDNDIPYVAQSFGYLTAVDRARDVLEGAHAEARSALHGVGLVKLMGREAGFIACGATLASQEVNFTLVPEVPLVLGGERGFLAALRRRLEARRHALVVVAEGAGQDLLTASAMLDASGNRRLGDIGPFLKQAILNDAASHGYPADVKYIDPSYYIRSARANSTDCLLCDHMARHAVHAAMAGRTGMIVGYCHDAFFHVPMAMVNEGKKRVDPEGELWRSVLASTGQPQRWS